MTGRFLRPLDRYVFGEFVKIFVVTALGFPILVFVIDVVENLNKYLGRQITIEAVALSYVYWLPETMFNVLPAAVLFATVFTVGAVTRHSEITAAKASGISFYRLIMPILVAAALVSALDVVLGEVVPITNRRRNELLEQDKARVGTYRGNFAFAGEYGRVYKAMELRTDSGTIRALQIERKGKGREYPTYLLAADTAIYRAGRWTLRSGGMDVIADSGPPFTVLFQFARDRKFTEGPLDMMAKPRDPHDQRYDELSRSIASTERSGGEANHLRVERALKLAIPATCLIIALFGAPLATTTQRGGSALGIAISLATTMTFLVLIQLTRAIGVSGLVPADYAAWIPSVLFGTMGLVLLARVRT